MPASADALSLKEQNQKLDLSKDIRPLIDYYNDNEGKAAQDKETNLSFLNFCNILFSMSNEIFNKEKLKIFQVNLDLFIKKVKFS